MDEREKLALDLDALVKKDSSGAQQGAPPSAMDSEGTPPGISLVDYPPSPEDNFETPMSPGAATDDSSEGETTTSLFSSGESTRAWFMRLLQSAGVDTLQQLQQQEEEHHEPVLTSFDLEGVVRYINSDQCRHIITMAGAGISTSAGIPDFRSPGSGLYHNLQKYNLPSPESIFQLGYFKENPEPFYQLAKELWPGTFVPTPCHYFIKLLREKGYLLRHYTQNIDTLERVAGLGDEDLVEAHGTFHQAHCVLCEQQYTQDWLRERVFSDVVPRCTAEGCGGLIKPDIVFFGEALPKKFFERVQEDLPKCDLLIVMGTSLVVQPFASLASRIPDETPRLYINLDPPPRPDPLMALLGMGCDFRVNSPTNYRDVFWQGTCDDGCKLLADKLGWKSDLDEMLAAAPPSQHSSVTYIPSPADSAAAAAPVSPDSSATQDTAATVTSPGSSETPAAPCDAAKPEVLSAESDTPA